MKEKSVTQDFRLLPPASELLRLRNEEITKICDNIKDKLCKEANANKSGVIKSTCEIPLTYENKIIKELKSWVKLQNYSIDIERKSGFVHDIVVTNKVMNKTMRFWTNFSRTISITFMAAFIFCLGGIAGGTIVGNSITSHAPEQQDVQGNIATNVSDQMMPAETIDGNGVTSDYSGVLLYSGAKWWYKNGQLHRDIDPAVEWSNGSKWWYKNGKVHRDTGPAIENADGHQEWWLNGKRVSEQEWRELAEVGAQSMWDYSKTVGPTIK